MRMSEWPSLSDVTMDCHAIHNDMSRHAPGHAVGLLDGRVCCVWTGVERPHFPALWRRHVGSACQVTSDWTRWCVSNCVSGVVQ